MHHYRVILYLFDECPCLAWHTTAYGTKILKMHTVVQ